MVYYALLVGAELDGLTNLQPSRGCDDPNFPYYLKLKCENCGEVTAKATYVTLSEQVDQPKGHGTAHLVQKVPSQRAPSSSGQMDAASFVQ